MAKAPGSPPNQDIQKDRISWTRWFQDVANYLMAVANSLSTLSSNFSALPALSSQSLQTPLTGFSITIPTNTRSMLLNPAGTLASGTITMPPNPVVDGQFVTIASSQTITTLTVLANSGQTLNGAVTTLPLNGFATWQFNLSTTTWYRVG